MSEINRRRFLGRTGKTTLALAGAMSSGVHAQGSDIIKVGLLGCGGRGNGAIRQCLQAAVEANRNSLNGRKTGPATWINELVWREF